MNIKTSDLRKFKQLSSHIRPIGILPSSDCVKFGNGQIIKNANSAFISYNCPESNEDFLVDEHVLFSLVAGTASEVINISVKGGKSVISDGRDKPSCGLIDPKEFHSLQEPESEKMPLSAEFMQSLGSASEACLNYQTPATLYMFVHVGENTICAGNGFMGVCFPIEEDYTLVIEKKTASMISKLPFIYMRESQSHYFFYDEDVMMGFSKQEIGFSNMKRVILGGNGLTFSIDASDVKSFNSLTMALSQDFGLVTMSTGKFESWDSTKEIANEREAPSIKLSESFSYNAENMNKVLAALDVDDLDFHIGERMCHIKSKDTKAVALIAKIAK